MKVTVRLTVLICWLTAPGWAADCFVSGVATDGRGVPISEARVIAHSPPTTWEDLVEIHRADEKGRFSVSYPCNSRKTKLFVSPPLDFEAEFIPVTPPYNHPNKTNPLGSRMLPSIRRGTFNVGRVRAVGYFKIKVKFVDEEGKGLLPEKLNSLWMRIKTANREIMRFGSISKREEENSRSDTDSELHLTMPEGRWIFELSFNEDKGPFFYPDQLVVVEPANSKDPGHFLLRMSTRQ